MPLIGQNFIVPPDNEEVPPAASYPVQNTNTKPYRRAHPIYASLSTLTHGVQDQGDELDGQIVINFPAMPETIKLARTASYSNRAKSPVTPDGFHTYDYTEPLKIPLKFSLHAFDEEFCGSDGPVALLAITARLHALQMPIRPTGATRSASSTTLAGTPGKSGTDQGVEAKATEAVDGVASVDYGNKLGSTIGQFFYPPACVLKIILAEYQGKSLGINCVGFVEGVDVTLKGPWLQGGTGLSNLPSSADFEFTFVHQPAYTNNLTGGNGRVIASSALDVFKNLYNNVNNGDNFKVTYADLYGKTG